MKDGMTRPIAPINVNAKETIRTGRLVFDQDPVDRYTEMFGMAFILGSLLVLDILCFRWRVLGFAMVFSAMTAIFGWGWSHLKRTTEIRGVSDQENREIVLQTLHENKFGVVLNNPKYVIALTRMTGFSWGKQVSVVFHDGRILLNVVNLGLFNLKVPLGQARPTKALVRHITQKLSRIQRGESTADVSYTCINCGFENPAVNELCERCGKSLQMEKEMVD